MRLASSSATVGYAISHPPSRLPPWAARLVLIRCQKLQRRIANYRGLQVPIATLVSPTRTSIEDAPVNGNKTAQPEPKDGTSTTKRKYRRHPKVRPILPGATPPGRCCPRETTALRSTLTRRY